jgi:hypothetical protein
MQKCRYIRFTYDFWSNLKQIRSLTLRVLSQQPHDVVSLLIWPFSPHTQIHKHTQRVVNISRPVTDCSGRTLELGDANIPTLGEITFFARGLSQVEMEEIMSAGYSLKDIAVGKAMFAPETTPFDEVRSKVVEGFADAKNERSSSMSESKKQGSLTRGTMSNLDGKVKVEPPGMNVTNPQCNVRALPEFAAFQNETSCRKMKLTDQDSLLDTTTNKWYFPLIKTEYMQAGNNRPKDRVFYGEVLNKDLLSYDPENFPSWCNRSATFSIWWDPKPSKSELPPGGYIISKFASGQTTFTGKRTWSMYIGDGGVHSWGSPEVRINTPTDFDWGSRRHVALVFDHRKDEGCAYIDGSLLGCRKLSAGAIAKLDCQPTAYMAFVHRIPGMWQPTVVMQDWRYYREALSAEEVRSREFLRVRLFVCVCMSVQSDSFLICASASICSFSFFAFPSTSNF